MTDDEYSEAQLQIVWLASLVINLPLDEMRAAINRSEAVGPIVDPTLFKRAGKKLQQVKELVDAFAEVQRVALRHAATPTTNHRA